MGQSSRTTRSSRGDTGKVYLRGNPRTVPELWHSWSIRGAALDSGSWGSSSSGHYGYYGLTGNYRAMKRFVREVERIWQVSLNRRSQKSGMTRTRFFKLLLCLPLPQPTILNPYRGVPA